MASPLNILMQQYVDKWNELPIRLVWIRAKLGLACWVFVFAYGPSSEKVKSPKILELGECVGSFPMNECVLFYSET